MAHGGDEEQCIAALLHDVIEDQAAHMGGHEILRNMIATAFGPRVLRIVNDCTDADGDPKPPWLERKKSYIAHLDEVDDDTMLVVCCDKLDNLESIVSDVRNPLVGLNVFERFKGKQEGTIWYHTELRKPFMGNVPQALLDQYINGLEDLQKAIAAAS